MTTLKTITNTEINISANQSKRTFTIRKNGSKYRTYPFEKSEFEHAERFWTGNDWQNFLKTNDYYIVK